MHLKETVLLLLFYTIQGSENNKIDENLEAKAYFKLLLEKQHKHTQCPCECNNSKDIRNFYNKFYTISFVYRPGTKLTSFENIQSTKEYKKNES